MQVLTELLSVITACMEGIHSITIYKKFKADFEVGERTFKREK